MRRVYDTRQLRPTSNASDARPPATRVESALLRALPYDAVDRTHSRCNLFNAAPKWRLDSLSHETPMRVTQLQRPFPDTDCVADDFHPKGFFEAPHRFLARRPEDYFQQLYESCLRSHGEERDVRRREEYCREATAPLESQWAGMLSAFEEGLLVEPLREVAALQDPTHALAEAAKAHAGGDDELGRAFADLAVSGREAFERFRAAPPTPEEVANRVAATRPGLLPEQRLDVANWALDRSFDVVWALRTGANRSSLEWIAVSAPDDPPHRPVNIPASPYPQFDLDVTVRGLEVRSRMMIASGQAPTMVTPVPRTVPVDPVPMIDPNQRVIVFVHGHMSRLEECDGLLEPLTRRGFAVVAMDLPSCGYSTMVRHEDIDPAVTNSKVLFPILDFQDQFLLDCVRTLGERLRRDIGYQVSAWIGGSLGGNLCLRLARRDPLALSCLANFVPWSAASVWTSASDSFWRQIGAEKALERALEHETDLSRTRYFFQAFDESHPGLELRPQAEYWYRDGWEPCKERLMIGARAERHELYNQNFRRWHWRVAAEQLYFSHRAPVLSEIGGRTLLASGTGDNYAWSNIHDATRELGVELINTPGRLLSLEDTGHSIHVERPELLTRHIAAFAPPICPGGDRPEVWTDWSSLGGRASSDPTVGIQEDGRLVVFIRDINNRIHGATQYEPGGGFASWTEVGDGLDDNDRFDDGIAVGIKQDGSLELFAALMNQRGLAHIWQEKPNGAWGDWDGGLIGEATQGVAVSDRVGDGPSRLLLAIARRGNGHIHVRGQNRLGGWWANGFDLGQAHIVFPGTPATALNANRCIYIFARDAAGLLQVIGERSPDDWWPEWVNRGEIAGDPAAALDAGGRLRVFALSNVGELITIGESYPSAIGSWSNWFSLEGAVAENSRPAVRRNAWGQLQVFVRWNDGTIRTRRQLNADGTSWSGWLDLGGYSERNPAVAENLDGTLSLFVVGRGGVVYTRRQHNPYREEPLEREVTATGKNADREISSLCNDAEPWSPRSAPDAIRDIETGAHIYFVAGPSGRVEVRVVNGSSGKYLRTDPDASTTNNLDFLPECEREYADGS
jgi:pimeloyl-ACP methyl ester carboxylesterase